MANSDTKHFAETKHKDLIEKRKEKKAFLTTINRRDTMNKAYERGFMDKCAELGVDPSSLVEASSKLSNKITRKDILRAILNYEGIKTDEDARKYEFDGVKTIKDLKKLIKRKSTRDSTYDAEATMGDPKSWAMQYYISRRKDGKPAVVLAGD